MNTNEKKKGNEANINNIPIYQNQRLQIVITYLQIQYILLEIQAKNWIDEFEPGPW